MTQNEAKLTIELLGTVTYNQSKNSWTARFLPLEIETTAENRGQACEALAALLYDDAKETMFDDEDSAPLMATDTPWHIDPHGGETTNNFVIKLTFLMDMTRILRD